MVQKDVEIFVLKVSLPGSRDIQCLGPTTTNCKSNYNESDKLLHQQHHSTIQKFEVGIYFCPSEFLFSKDLLNEQCFIQLIHFP